MPAYSNERERRLDQVDRSFAWNSIDMERQEGRLRALVRVFA
jgi:hypothetical protein